MSGNPTIDTDSLVADIKEELHDLLLDEVISAGKYNVKNEDRLITHALIKADRHICLQEKVSSHVSIFIPAHQRTVFFSRQKRYESKFVSQHSEVKDSDAGQYAHLLAENQFLDVISVRSNWAHAYGDIPIDESEPKEVLEVAQPTQTEDPESRKYQLTSGTVEYERPQKKYFYVEPANRKLVLSTAFSGDRWLRFHAQIAPIDQGVIKQNDFDLDSYKIYAPYYTRQWLLMVAMQRLLSARVAQAGGYHDLEAKFKKQAQENRPGTGNVVISGHELDGNYEADMNDF